MTKLRDCWEHFPHGADIGVRGIGSTRERAFAEAARAMTAIVTEPDRVVPREVVEIACSAPDDELLLVDWLNAIVYEMETRRMLFSRFEITFRDGGLLGRAWGEPVNREKHRPIVEIKGATYTSLEVTCRPGGEWLAQCVVDV